MKDTFLILSGLLTVSASVPYARDILKGESKPNIVTWMTWTLLASIATIAEIAAGEYRTAAYTGAAVLETLIIVVLGLKYGRTKYTAFDVICQVGALFGLVLWAIFNSPTAAIIFAVSIDLIGSLPTVRHAWVRPGEESWEAYAIAGVAGALAIMALHSFTWASLTYAVYVALSNVVIYFILILRPRITPKLKRARA